MVRRERKSLRMIFLAILACIAMTGAPAAAQIESVDPDAAIDGDLMGGETAPPPISSGSEMGTEPSIGNGTPVEGVPVDNGAATTSGSADAWGSSDVVNPATDQAATEESTTYHEDDLIGAAEGVFGTGAKGLANLIQDLLAKQGEPNAYIAGREGSGALVFGLRYGSGTLYHKVEGNQPVYWTGPSLGFDAGLNAGKAFVLVYNLYDTDDLYKRFGAGEGQAYFIGGFHVSYLRRGNIVLIPVRMGAGVRLGANVGYMKFSHDQNWLPF